MRRRALCPAQFPAAAGAAWAVTTIIAWFAILITGAYPESLERFSRGVLRWNIRVEAYLLLLHDTYPPFHLDGEP